MRRYLRNSPHSSLTDSKVMDMHRMFREGLNDTQIADRLNVHRKTVYNVRQGNTWAHVPRPVTVRGWQNYEIYPDGRIWSRATKRFLSPRKRRDGELVVELRSGSKRRTLPVSNLVAKAFLKGRNKNVNYLDGNPSNVHYTNLSLA